MRTHRQRSKRIKQPVLRLNDDYTLIGKPRQLIKCVYGLRGDEDVCANLRLIHDDSTLMDMDAPECIPSGGMHAYLGLDRELLFVSERCFLRSQA